MTHSQEGLDSVTRHIIRDVDEDLRRWLSVSRLDYQILGALYLRVREVLDTSPAADDAVDELALTVYLTASAWQPTSEPPLELLSSLHQRIARTLSHEAAELAPEFGRRNA